MLLILLFYRRWNQGKEKLDGISLMAQWLRLCAPNARGPISIPGWGTSSHTTTGSLRMPPWRLKILHAATKRLGTATNDKNKKTPNWTIHEKNKIKTDQPETLSCGALQQRESLSIHLWKRVRKAGQGAGTAGPIGWPPQQRWVRSDPLLQIKPESLLHLLHRAGKMATVIKKKKKKKKGCFRELFVSKCENLLGRCWHSQNLKGGIWRRKQHSWSIQRVCLQLIYVSAWFCSLPWMRTGLDWVGGRDPESSLLRTIQEAEFTWGLGSGLRRSSGAGHLLPFLELM